MLLGAIGYRLLAIGNSFFASLKFYVVRPRAGSCYSCASRTSSTRWWRGFLGGPPPRTKQTAGTQGRCLQRYSANMPRVRPTAGTRRVSAEHSTDGGSARDTRECAGRSFSLYDYPNNIRGNGHRKESDPIPILCLSYSETPIRFQSGSNEVPMEIGGR